MVHRMLKPKGNTLHTNTLCLHMFLLKSYILAQDDSLWAYPYKVVQQENMEVYIETTKDTSDLIAK